MSGRCSTPLTCRLRARQWHARHEKRLDVCEMAVSSSVVADAEIQGKSPQTAANRYVSCMRESLSSSSHRLRHLTFFV